MNITELKEQHREIIEKSNLFISEDSSLSYKVEENDVVNDMTKLSLLFTIEALNYIKENPKAIETMIKKFKEYR
jgi:hypothetical protein